MGVIAYISFLNLLVFRESAERPDHKRARR